LKREVVDGSPKGKKRKLSQEEIKEILSKQVDGESKAGPKTEEGKRRALENLRPQVSKDIEIEDLPKKANISNKYLTFLKVLNEEERAYFNQRWNELAEEYELNSAADEGLLRIAVMCELSLDRLFERQINDEKGNYIDKINKISKTYRDTLGELGTTRKARLGSKAGKEENIASIIANFDGQKLHLEEKKGIYVEEEDRLMKLKTVEFIRDLEDAEQDATKGLGEDTEFDEEYEEYKRERLKEEEEEEQEKETGKKDIWDYMIPQRKPGT